MKEAKKITHGHGFVKKKTVQEDVVVAAAAAAYTNTFRLLQMPIDREKDRKENENM